MPLSNRLDKMTICCEPNIKKQRVGTHSLDRAGYYLTFNLSSPRDDFYPASGLQSKQGNFLGLNILVRRWFHFFPSGQIHPKLEPAHAAALLLRHFGMNDSTASGHPLHRTRLQITAIAKVVLMQHG